MGNRRPILSIIIFFLAYLLINLIYEGKGYSDQYNALISVATILFGIFIAFSIYNNQNKLSRIKELLRGDDANLISLYKQISVFGEEKQEELKKLLDEYLVYQIDYKLKDYIHSSRQFMNIFDFLLTLSPKTDQQMMNYQSIIDIANASFANRKLVEATV